MSTRIRLSIACLAALLFPAVLPAQTPPADRAPEITSIRGDLYRVRHGQRDTVFLVTPEGIIVGDPLS
jgi:hypothetical protein